MTAPPQPPLPPVTVTPEPGGELAKWQDQRESAIAALAEAKAHFEDVKAHIETLAIAQATRQNNGTVPAAVDIAGSASAPGLKVRYHGGETTFDKERFIREWGQGFYDKYQKPKKPYWKTEKL